MKPGKQELTDDAAAQINGFLCRRCDPFGTLAAPLTVPGAPEGGAGGRGAEGGLCAAPEDGAHGRRRDAAGAGTASVDSRCHEKGASATTLESASASADVVERRTAVWEHCFEGLLRPIREHRTPSTDTNAKQSLRWRNKQQRKRMWSALSKEKRNRLMELEVNTENSM